MVVKCPGHRYLMSDQYLAQYFGSDWGDLIIKSPFRLLDDLSRICEQLGWLEKVYSNQEAVTLVFLLINSQQ